MNESDQASENEDLEEWEQPYAVAIHYPTSFPSDDKDLIVERSNKLVSRLTRDWSELRYQVELEVLLLIGWCRLHDLPHSEFTCQLCQKEIGKVKGQVGQPSALFPTVASRAEVEVQEPEPSYHSAQGNPQEGVGTTTKGGQQHSSELSNDEVDQTRGLSIDHKESFPTKEHLYAMVDRIYGGLAKADHSPYIDPLDGPVSLAAFFPLRIVPQRHSDT